MRNDLQTPELPAESDRLAQTVENIVETELSERAVVPLTMQNHSLEC
jgi:hypothetical protein